MGMQGHHYDTSLTIQHFRQFWRVKAHHCENEIRHIKDVMQAPGGGWYDTLTFKTSGSVSATIFILEVQSLTSFLRSILMRRLSQC